MPRVRLGKSYDLAHGLFKKSGNPVICTQFILQDVMAHYFQHS